jgi:hypothetical protein
MIYPIAFTIFFLHIIKDDINFNKIKIVWCVKNKYIKGYKLDKKYISK